MQLPRKFVDLIRRAEGKMPCWDPELVVEVGDYGVLDQNGAFSRKGNIYTDMIDEVPSLVLFTPVDGLSGDQYELGVRANYVSEAGVSGGASQVTVGGNWKFGRDRGAFLLMSKWRVRYIPPTVDLDALLRSKKLSKMGLVTHVWLSPDFARYLSDTGGDSISVKLVAKFPLPYLPGTNVDLRHNLKWEANRSSATLKCAIQADFVYTPLYTLKKLERKLPWYVRGTSPSDGEDEGVDKLSNFDLPWSELDEDGEEDPSDI